MGIFEGLILCGWQLMKNEFMKFQFQGSLWNVVS